MGNDNYSNLKLLKEGNTSAFESLYNQYSGKLYHFVMKITNGNTWLTEELVQRTFIKIWESRAHINLEKSFLSYMCTIAKNMLLNDLEHQTVEFIYQEYAMQNELAAEYTTDKEMNLKFLEEMVDKLSNQLPPARKRIFLLSKRKDYSVKEIAKELNLAETTVQTQLTKALIFMKNQLLKYYYLALLLI
ncbi:MAG: RNA polymerase sigma-70 factor [Tannerella sp.]|jgi:RNA polymerase sigma-70 factor (ECF subfamily)|nr:RNA polymerase sigma-70 factor [Tannerella sp.]